MSQLGGENLRIKARVGVILGWIVIASVVLCLILGVISEVAGLLTMFGS